MKAKALLVFLLILVLMVSISACAPKAGEADTIKLGVLAPLTGPIAAYGQDQVNGVTMAVEEINAAGGLLGKKLVIQVEDDEKKPELAASLTQKLINDKVDVIIGGMSSSSTMAGGPIAIEQKCS